MIWEWYAVIGCGVLGVAATYIGLLTDGYMWPGEIVIINVLAWVATLILFIMSLIGTIGPSIDRNRCHKFGEQSGFKVKFIKYNTLSWDCLVSVNGHWISQSNLQNVVINKGD